MSVKRKLTAGDLNETVSLKILAIITEVLPLFVFVQDYTRCPIALSKPIRRLMNTIALEKCLHTLQHPSALLLINVSFNWVGLVFQQTSKSILWFLA